MRNIARLGVVILGCVLPAVAQVRTITPTAGGIRFSEQISNGPAGNCGCFAMEGFGADAAWNLREFGPEHSRALKFVTDLSLEHTGKISNAPYGLTLTTLAFGPRVERSSFKSSRVFVQTLAGFTHGSNSEFPGHNALQGSANSFAFVLGGGADRPLGAHVSFRIIQLQYLRTSLPNNSSNWQNNLQIATGLKFTFAKR